MYTSWIIIVLFIFLIISFIVYRMVLIFNGSGFNAADSIEFATLISTGILAFLYKYIEHSFSKKLQDQSNNHSLEVEVLKKRLDSHFVPSKDIQEIIYKKELGFLDSTWDIENKIINTFHKYNAKNFNDLSMGERRKIADYVVDLETSLVENIPYVDEKITDKVEDFIKIIQPDVINNQNLNELLLESRQSLLKVIKETLNIYKASYYLEIENGI